MSESGLVQEGAGARQTPLAPSSPREDHWPAQPDPAARYDYMGRKQPHRLGFMQFARAIPGYAGAFQKKVPDNFAAQVADGVVEVACPCGETPRLEWMVPTPCACERTFVNTGSAVRVARVTEPPSS